jgi:hypothetical protein
MSLITATVRTIKDLETFDNTEFTKKSLFLETLENKTPLKIDFSNDKIELLNDLQINQCVIIEYRIRGNYSPDGSKLYNSFEGYSLKVI